MLCISATNLREKIRMKCLMFLLEMNLSHLISLDLKLMITAQINFKLLPMKYTNHLTKT